MSLKLVPYLIDTGNFRRLSIFRMISKPYYILIWKCQFTFHYKITTIPFKLTVFLEFSSNVYLNGIIFFVCFFLVETFFGNCKLFWDYFILQASFVPQMRFSAIQAFFDYLCVSGIQKRFWRFEARFGNIFFFGFKKLDDSYLNFGSFSFFSLEESFDDFKLLLIRRFKIFFLFF